METTILTHTARIRQDERRARSLRASLARRAKPRVRRTREGVQRAVLARWLFGRRAAAGGTA